METEDLNQLIRKLNASAEEPDAPGEQSQLEVIKEDALSQEKFIPSSGIIEPESGSSPLHLYLAEVVQRDGTDLLLVPGAPATIRVNGTLVPLNEAPLAADDAITLLAPFLPAERKQQFVAAGAVDLAIAFSNGRFRINLHRTRRGVGAAFRLLPRTIPSVAELGLPISLEDLTRLKRGLILVTGPTGCGKSTTLAALIALINRQQRRHIVTIEDPVEYEHFHGNSIVEQVEVGSDAPGFAEALRAALRQDPEVILVGEMRDLETVSTVLTAAETGHLVFTTLHTNDAAQTIHRIVDVFPSEQQPQIRQQLSMALTAIIYQQLIPKQNGKGRVVACEVLIGNDAVRHHIRKGTLHQLHSEMTLGRKMGMLTLEDSLSQLVRAGFITEDEAKNRAVHVEELTSYLKD
ncbi:PilT/PilU family type 4a pilus ATPase [bacterium]|nr:PilT/PilU family type 4a pilus ATPase [bacterium]